MRKTAPKNARKRSGKDFVIESSVAAQDVFMQPTLLLDRLAESGRLGRLLPRGSHGSGRADCPHPALRSTDLLRDTRSAPREVGRAGSASEARGSGPSPSERAAS